MKARARFRLSLPTLVFFYAALFTVASVGCAHLLPQYQETLDAYEAQIASVADQRNAIAADLATTRDALRDAQSVLEVQRQTISSMDSGPERDALAAAVAVQEQQVVALQSAIETQKASASGLEAAETSIVAAKRSHQVESGATVAGSVLGLLGTLLGLRAQQSVNVAKTLPSRAQGEVDELWQKLADMARDAAGYKAQLTTLLDVVSKSMAAAPQIQLIAPSTPASPTAGAPV